MNQICQYCSYESPLGARFCRQCGAQLYGETEVATASTRNFGRQEAAPSVVTVGSGHLPPSVAEVIGGETGRYYQSPYIPAPVITPTSHIGSGNRPWRWVLVFFVLLLGIAIGALAVGNSARRRRDPVSAEQLAQRRAEEEARRQQENQRREINDRLREAKDRAREAKDRAREALERMREATERANEAGAALPSTGEKLIDLSHYEYPGATMSNAIRIPGREMLTMRTSDDFDTVSQFYQKKISKPVILINEPWEKKLIFHSNSVPPIAVSIESAPGVSGPELKITVLRSPFQKLNLVETGAEP
jgi:hypothetical protein